MKTYTKEKIEKYKKELEDLIKSKPDNYSRIIKTRRLYLLDFINYMVPQYQTDDYSLPTKCYAVLNNLTSVHICRECGNEIKNVRNINIGFPKYCSIACTNKSKEHIEHCKETCLKHFGVTVPAKSKIVKDKMMKTCLERYGTELPGKFGSFKYRQTMLRKYGVEFPSLSNSIKEKRSKTIKEKYGVENPFAAEEIKKKIREKWIKKYGVDNPLKNQRLFNKARKKYTYNNIQFDSKPEIAYFIWLSDNCIDFVYHPDIKIKYIAENKKIKFYYPDFIVNGQYIEIKSSWMIKNGILFDPYSKRFLYEKQKCLDKNNVKIITENEYQKYIDYVNMKYGDNYLNEFKNR